MVFGLLRRWRRRRWQREGLSAEQHHWLQGLPALAGLSEPEQEKLEGLTRVFLEEKYFEGCGGLEMSDKIRTVVAAQACLLILELDHAWYQRVRSILVYPGAYRHRQEWSDEHGVVRTQEGTNLGEAWPGGPVVLAWDAAYQGGRDHEDGYNTVLHEFAHKLDMLDGQTDGVPPLPGEQRTRWEEVLEREYAAARRAAKAGRRVFLDPYAATDPAEFFAVAVESFFERPRRMRERHEELYGLMCAFFRQDPAART